MKVEDWPDSAPIDAARTGQLPLVPKGTVDRVSLRPRVSAIIGELEARPGQLVPIMLVFGILAMLGVVYLALPNSGGGDVATQTVDPIADVTVAAATSGADSATQGRDSAAAADGSQPSGDEGLNASPLSGAEADSRRSAGGIPTSDPASPSTNPPVSSTSTTAPTTTSSSTTAPSTTAPPTTAPSTTAPPTTAPPTTAPPNDSGAICSVNIRKSTKLRDEPGGDTIGEVSRGSYDVYQIADADKTWYLIGAGQGSGWIEARSGRVRTDC